MSDRHIRILRHIARQAQHKLDRHNTLEAAEDVASTGRRRYLKHAVKRTGAQVAAAEQRRDASER